MKRIVLFFLLITFSLHLFPQVIGGVHSKLAMYYKNQQWEDCAFKADRMILKPKYEKDAEVYLYLAASYNKIFLMCLEDTSLLYKIPDYINAYKNALKYSVKAKKLDRKAKIIFPKNDFMLEEIAISGIHYIDNYNLKGKYPKSASFMRKIMRTYEDDNLKFYFAVLSLKSNDTTTSNPIIREVFEKIDEGEIEPKNTDFIMIDAFDFYANMLLEQEPPLIDSAKHIINKALKIFPSDPLILYWAKKVENPELDISKPENSKKISMLKYVKFSTSIIDDEDEEDEDEGEEDEEDEDN